MNKIYNNVSAILLAGGKSTRMKSDKSLLKINDITMIEYIVNQLRCKFKQIIIASNNIEKHSFLGLRVVEDIEKGQGPLMGILSSLEASETKLNFVTACDIPDLDINFIEKLIQASEDYDAVIPLSDKNKYEPLFAVYNKSIIPKIYEQLKLGDRKIQNLLTKINLKCIHIKGNFLRNINTKNDFESFMKSKSI